MNKWRKVGCCLLASTRQFFSLLPGAIIVGFLPFAACGDVDSPTLEADLEFENSVGEETEQYGIDVDELPVQPLEDGVAEPNPTVTDAATGRLLTLHEDYELAYENNDSVGTGSVTVMGLEEYAGLERTLTYEIREPYYSVGGETVGKSSFVGTGNGWTNSLGEKVGIPAAGYVYVVDGSVRSATTTFLGDGLAMRGVIFLRPNQVLTVPELSVASATALFCGCENGCGSVAGRIVIPGDAKLTLNSGYPNTTLGLAADICGRGELVESGTSGSIYSFSGNNRAFYGRVTAVHPSLHQQSQHSFLSADSWFGDVKTFDPMSICWTNVTAYFGESIEANTPHRGITLAVYGSKGSSRFGVAGGKRVTLDSPIAAAYGFIKEGDGTLVLKGASPNLRGTISVTAGTLEVAATDALGSATVAVAAGARLALLSEFCPQELNMTLASGAVLRFCSTADPVVLETAPVMAGAVGFEMMTESLPDEDHRLVDILSLPLDSAFDLDDVTLLHHTDFTEAAYAKLETREENGRLVVSVRYVEFPEGWPYRRDPQTKAVQSRLRLTTDGMGSFTVNGVPYDTEAWTDTNATVTVRYVPAGGEVVKLWMDLPPGAVVDPSDSCVFTASAEFPADVHLQLVSRKDANLEFESDVPFVRFEPQGRIVYVIDAAVAATAFTVQRDLTLEEAVVVGGGRGEVIDSIRPRFLPAGARLSLAVGDTAEDASELVIGEEETLTAAGGTTGGGIVTYLTGAFASYGLGGSGTVILSFSVGDTTARHGIEVDALTVQPLEAGAAEPNPTVTDAVTGKVLALYEDYELAYANNGSVGTGVVAVVGLEEYAGLVRTLTYEIREPYYSAGDDVINTSSFVGTGKCWTNSLGGLVKTPAPGNVYVVVSSVRSATKTFQGDGLILRGGIAMPPNQVLTVPELSVASATALFSGCAQGCGSVAGRIVILGDAKLTLNSGYDGKTLGLAADICGRGELVESGNSGSIYSFSGNNRAFYGRVTAVHPSLHQQSQHSFLSADSWFGDVKTFDPMSICWTNVTAYFGESIEANTPHRGITLAINGSKGSSRFGVAGGKRVTLDSPIAAAYGFIKEGDGTLVLKGASPNLRGTISVTAGTLEAAATDALGSATVAVTDGARLGFSSESGPLVLAAAPTGSYALEVPGEIPDGRVLDVYSLPAEAAFDASQVTVVLRTERKTSMQGRIRTRVKDGRRLVSVRYFSPGTVIFVR